MSIKKLIAAAVTVLCVSTLLCTSALAVDLEDERFRDKTWEEIFSDFLTERNIDPDSVTAGYYNTVTGEEHYHNKDRYMYAASMVKLPTNMIYAERIYNGEMTFDTIIRGNRYELIQYSTLVHSDNALTDAMIMDLGGGSFYNFRRVLGPFIGLTEEELTDEFISTNVFTPAQLMNVLKMLYSDPERYPGVLENMLKANPGWYFESGSTEFEIAHKYGWLTYHGVNYLNDCGIVYTDDPILLVLFTASVDDALTVLGEYADLMADYAQYTRAIRYTQDAAASCVPTVGTPLQVLTAAEDGFDPAPVFMALAVAGIAVLLVGIVLLLKKKKWAAVPIALAAIMIAAGAAPFVMARQAAASDEPAQRIEELEQWLTGDAHEDDLTALAADTFDLTASTPVRKGMTITVPVTVTKTDLDAVNTALTEVYPGLLAPIVETEETELYDENGTFLGDAADTAAKQAVDTVTARWDSYSVTDSGTVTLQLTRDGWTVVIDEELVRLCSHE